MLRSRFWLFAVLGFSCAVPSALAAPFSPLSFVPDPSYPSVNRGSAWVSPSVSNPVVYFSVAGLTSGTQPTFSASAISLQLNPESWGIYLSTLPRYQVGNPIPPNQQSLGLTFNIVVGTDAYNLCAADFLDGTFQGLDTTSGTVYSLANVLALNCGHAFGYNPGPDQILISDISLGPSSLIALSKFDAVRDIQQDGATISPDTGLLQLKPDAPITVVVHVVGNGLLSSDTRSVALTLQAGQQPLQTRIISLASVAQAPGQVIQIPFTVSFDAKKEGGAQTITATVDPANTLQQSDTTQDTQSVQVNVNVPQLNISSPQLTQAVNDFKLPNSPADVDLVRRKSTAAIFDVSVQDDASALRALANDTTPVAFTIDLGDGSGPVAMTPISPVTPITLGSIVRHGGTQEVTLAPILPRIASAAGAFTVKFKASAMGAKDGEATMTARVKETNPFPIVYVPFKGAYGAPADPQAHATASSKFIQEIFPVADGAVTSEIATELNGSSDTSLWGWAADLGWLWLVKKRTDSSARNAVSIVPSAYWTYHAFPSNLGIHGATPFPGEGYDIYSMAVRLLSPDESMVEEGYWEGTAHEIGHTFGFSDQGTGQIASLEGFDGVDHSFVFGLPDLMGPVPDVIASFFERLNSVWISSDQYASIFQQLLTNPGDPQVMILSGVISSENLVKLNPIYFQPSGVVSPFVSESGFGEVSGIDSSGATVFQSSFLNSLRYVTSAGDVNSLPDVPFVVEVPAGSTASLIQVENSGKTLARFNPSAQLLTDAMSEISDASFADTDRIDSERNDLVKQASRIKRKIELCLQFPIDPSRGDHDKAECIGSVLNMISELRKVIDRELDDSAQIADPLRMTKPQVLSTVDFVLLQLMPARLVRARTHSFRIRIVPDELLDLVKISTLGQAAQGTVTVLDRGVVGYDPDSASRRADSFVVTLGDSEGGTIVKTVSILAPARNDYDSEEKSEIFSSVEQLMRLKSRRR